MKLIKNYSAKILFLLIPLAIISYDWSSMVQGQDNVDAGLSVYTSAESYGAIAHNQAVVQSTISEKQMDDLPIKYFIIAESNRDIYQAGWNDLNKNGTMDPYENPGLEIEKRIDDLLARMSIEEKTCQMVTLYGFGRVLMDELPTENWQNELWKDGIGNIDEHLNGLDRPGTQTEYSWPPSKHARAINEVQKFFIEKTRLGIPVDFTNEGIRGICHEKGTSFPAQIGIGSTWDVDLVSRIGHITGSEGRILGYTNIYSPILDLARDPRWGRTVECYGEDPYLVSQLGLAQTIALQSEKVVSTPKHFAVYSIPKGGRDGNARTDPHVAPREVHTIYLKPFKEVFTKGGALGTMSSYNDYDGVPITGSKYFLTDLLRKEWGFKGYIVSDSRAVDFIYSKHHVAPDYKDAVRQAVEAGLNIRTDFTTPDVYVEPLRELITDGSVSMSTIDARVRDVLRVKYILGLFDRPYVLHPDSADIIVANPDHQKVALEASRKSIILLKNENNFLPLKKDIQTILVTGPNAMAINHSISRYGPSKINVISVLEGLKKFVGTDTEVLYTKGCDITDPNWPESEILPEPPDEAQMAGIKEAEDLARKADVAIVVVGGDETTTGESRSRTSLDLPGYQLELVKAVYSSGTPTVVVLINGRPLTVNWIDKYVPAIVEAWFPGEQGGRAVAEVLFGDYNPGGKLSITFPKSVGQLPLNFPYKPGSDAGSGDHTRVMGVLYPFGHGLSYTSFKYKNLNITPKTQGTDGSIEVTFDIINSGDRPGDEVVQLYVNDETSSVTTYVKNLRGFKRISLAPGERKQVKFELSPEDLSLFNTSMNFVVEPGKFNVMIGSSSEDIRLQDSFDIM